MPFYINPISLDGGNYTITRATSAPGVTPTLAEVGKSTFVDGSVIMNLLPNGNVERWVVQSGVPVLTNTDIGPRRFTALPDPADFNPATSDTALDGDVIELWGNDNGNGYYECIATETTLEPGPPFSCWIGRTISDPATNNETHKVVTAQHISDGYVEFWQYSSYRPLDNAVGIYNETTGEGYNDVVAYDPVTQTVTLPSASLTVGDLLLFSAQLGDVKDMYTHDQTVASASWTITHNLGFYPYVFWITDAAYVKQDSAVLVSSLVQTDTNTVVVNLTSSVAGRIRLA